MNIISHIHLPFDNERAIKIISTITEQITCPRFLNFFEFLKQNDARLVIDDYMLDDEYDTFLNIQIKNVTIWLYINPYTMYTDSVSRCRVAVDYTGFINKMWDSIISDLYFPMSKSRLSLLENGITYLLDYPGGGDSFYKKAYQKSEVKKLQFGGRNLNVYK